jgi:hypothetical protein
MLRLHRLQNDMLEEDRKRKAFDCAETAVSK